MINFTPFKNPIPYKKPQPSRHPKALNSAKQENILSALSFRGLYPITKIPVSQTNKLGYCTHETYFFRNIDTLNFVSDYLEKNYKWKDINVADFGCSNGKEPYSLAILFSKFDKDQKINITGYDNSIQVIEEAQSGVYTFEHDGYENFLFDRTIKATEQQRNLRKLFNNSFEFVDKKIVKRLTTTKKSEKTCREQLESETDKDNIAKLNACLKIAEHKQYYSKNVAYAKPDKLNVKFKLGCINELGRSIKLIENTPVILFKNALYHLANYGGEKNVDDLDLTAVEKAISSVHESLPINGLFVTGHLDRDYMCHQDHKYDKDCFTEMEQGGEKIKVYTASPLYKLLKQKGFEPVYFEQKLNGHGRRQKNSFYLPSVWKKAV